MRSDTPSTPRIHRLLPTVLVVAAAIATTVGIGLLDSRESQAAQSANPKLEEQMSTIKRSMRKLRRQLKDAAKNADSLTVVLSMQASAAQAKLMEPGKAGALEGEAKKKFIDDYRMAMCDMQKQLLDLEKLLIQGRTTRRRSSTRRSTSRSVPPTRSSATERQRPIRSCSSPGWGSTNSTPEDTSSPTHWTPSASWHPV